MSTAIVTEMIRHSLLAAAEEMARNLCRTSFNTVVYEIHDYGIGIHDEFGDVVADAPGIAIFTRANDYGVQRAIDFLGRDTLRPGDIFLLNFPYWSSAHTLDPLVFAPVFHGERLIGFTSCRIHVLDLKQKDVGYVLDSTDMYQEGIFFPATRLYRAGVKNDEFFNIVQFNSRMPERTIGDIQAQVSACQMGVKRVQEIANKYGVEVYGNALTAIHDHGERLARIALASMPKGTWSAHDYVDSDGIDDALVTMKVTVTVTDDEFVVDWTGSQRDVLGPINVPRGLTEAVCCLIFKALSTPEAPVVAGNFRPMRVITDPGSLMHAEPPMATFTMWTALLAGEVVLKALSQGMPDRVPACSGGDIATMMGLGINPRTGSQWLEATNEAVGLGAHSGGDGADGVMHPAEPGCRNNPIEVLETKSPMLIEAYGFRTDSGGPGRFRGGVGIGRTYRFLAPTIGICTTYKTRTRPWAIGEGKEGESNHVILNPGTERETRQGASYNRLDTGEVLVNNTGGGGGWGHPFDRDPYAVLEDVIDGFVSADAAAAEYGVRIDLDSATVIESQTAELRARSRRA